MIAGMVLIALQWLGSGYRHSRGAEEGECKEIVEGRVAI